MNDLPGIGPFDRIPNLDRNRGWCESRRRVGHFHRRYVPGHSGGGKENGHGHDEEYLCHDCQKDSFTNHSHLLLLRRFTTRLFKTTRMSNTLPSERERAGVLLEVLAVGHFVVAPFCAKRGLVERAFDCGHRQKIAEACIKPEPVYSARLSVGVVMPETLAWNGFVVIYECTQLADPYGRSGEHVRPDRLK